VADVYAMFDRDFNALNRVTDLTGKIAVELALSVPGDDGGLVPVNSLFCQIEEESDQLPSEIQEALGAAKECIERVFESSGMFDEISISQLTAWTNWMNVALLDALNGDAIVPFSKDEPVLAMESGARESGLVLDIENDGELLVEFCNESYEHLQNIEQGVLVLEMEPENADTLNTIFRAFHTFKGGAGLLNLAPIRDLAHELETVLDMARTHISCRLTPT